MSLNYNTHRRSHNIMNVKCHMNFEATMFQKSMHDGNAGDDRNSKGRNLQNINPIYNFVFFAAERALKML